MRFYAANTDDSAETSTGFSKTWYVLAFARKQARKQYVAKAPGSAAHSIKKKDVTMYVKRTPTPFSGERYALVTPGCDDIPGLLGEIDVARTTDAQYIEAL